ncbi:hypothetical protein DSECCO2_648310 [anaerobic digester metagenome]
MVAGDDVQLVQGLAQELGGLLGDVAVRGAVEAVAADAQRLVQVVGQRVKIRLLGHGLVELGVEHAHGRRVRKEFFRHFDAREVGGVVQRTQRNVVADDALGPFVDLDGLLDLFAAEQHAVTHGVDFALVGDDALLGIGDQVHDLLHAFDMIGERLFEDDLFLGVGVGLDLVGQFAHAFADALDKTGAQGLLGGHVDELVLDGRAAGVDDEYVHAGLFLSGCGPPGRVGGPEGRVPGACGRPPGCGCKCPGLFPDCPFARWLRQTSPSISAKYEKSILPHGRLVFLANERKS